EQYLLAFGVLKASGIARKYGPSDTQRYSRCQRSTIGLIGQNRTPVRPVPSQQPSARWDLVK
ncbi:MAG: hypothetical protein WAN68_21025, partial [Pseudolabrys sp.]